VQGLSADRRHFAILALESPHVFPLFAAKRGRIQIKAFPKKWTCSTPAEAPRSQDMAALHSEQTVCIVHPQSSVDYRAPGRPCLRIGDLSKPTPRLSAGLGKISNSAMVWRFARQKCRTCSDSSWEFRVELDQTAITRITFSDPPGRSFYKGRHHRPHRSGCHHRPDHDRRRIPLAVVHDRVGEHPSRRSRAAS
jgi:hypothetical protein